VYPNLSQLLKKLASNRCRLPLLFTVGIAIASCSTPASRLSTADKAPQSQNAFEKFSQVPFGSSIQSIFESYGEPQKAYFISDSDAYLLVYQREPKHPQRYYFEFDRTSKKLTGKTFEPLSNEKEYSYPALQTRFKSAEFYSPPRSMCNSHYVMNEGLVFIWGTGVSLYVDPRTKTVGSVTWGPIQEKPRNPAELPDGCPHGGKPTPAKPIENPRSLL
jgi:hypothetical protein